MQVKRYGESIAATHDGCDFKLLPVDEKELGLWVKATDYDTLEASIPERERKAFVAGALWGQGGDPTGAYDVSNMQAEAARRFP